MSKMKDNVYLGLSMMGGIIMFCIVAFVAIGLYGTAEGSQDETTLAFQRFVRWAFSQH